METKEFEISKYTLSLKPIRNGFLITNGGEFVFINDENEIRRMFNPLFGSIPLEIANKCNKHKYDSLDELSEILEEFVYEELNGEEMSDEFPGIMLDIEMKITARTVDSFIANLKDFKDFF